MIGRHLLLAVICCTIFTTYCQPIMHQRLSNDELPTGHVSCGTRRDTNPTSSSGSLQDVRSSSSESEPSKSSDEQAVKEDKEVTSSISHVTKRADDDVYRAMALLNRRSALDKNFMRFGRSGNSNFMRFGRSGNSNFMRFGRKGDSNFMRFGRNNNSNNFMRFGRGSSSNFLRFGRDQNDEDSYDSQYKENDMLRQPRKDNTPNFMRFGRQNSNNQNFMRFGRADPASKFMRLGKSQSSNFMRFGRGKLSNFIRLGRDSYPEDNLLGSNDQLENKYSTFSHSINVGDMQQPPEINNDIFSEDSGKTRVRRSTATPLDVTYEDDDGRSVFTVPEEEIEGGELPSTISEEIDNEPIGIPAQSLSSLSQVTPKYFVLSEESPLLSKKSQLLNDNNNYIRFG